MPWPAVRASAPVAVPLAALAVAVYAFAPQPGALGEMARQALAVIDGERSLPGLRSDVRVVRDRWGVPHIYARSPEDLFFAQGYVAAQDRLWQMEMWRRGAEGRLAEILGAAAVGRDRTARLLKYRGHADDRELSTYHPEARRLMTAFVAGVNAFVTHAEHLPIEFTLTGIKPEPWTIETLLLRQISFGDASSELQLARSVAELGREEANRRRNPDPWDPLTLPDGFDPTVMTEEALAATRERGRLPDPEILPAYRSVLAGTMSRPPDAQPVQPGSNNWVVSGALSATGKPVVANDPHRTVTLPSLRYIVHLSAPGWNVIGAVEPPFFGIAIGHNEHVAWGLTIVGTDQQDVYIEELNPANPDEVRYQGRWERLRMERERIAVKGETPREIVLKFSRHGPIFHEDRGRHRAFALRSALHEPGTAPYLAGLRLAQTRDCRQFLEEAMYWYAPSENLICGDTAGNIAWQASALTPQRKGWVGRLPVPGTGAYEWQGFRSDLPRELNPDRGFIATANHNVQPKDYHPPFMFKSADTRFDRITRLLQLLQPGRRYTIDDHKRMQTDAYSLRAAADLEEFRGWSSADAQVERARALLAGWDAVYTAGSGAAALYETWRRVPTGRGAPPRGSAEWLRAAEARLRRAVDTLKNEQGADPSTWRWGRLHARRFDHPFISAFDLQPIERPGGAATVAADGASYREILDVGDWDRSIVTNTPGQSAQPGSPFYGNLLPLWARDEYFPLVYSPAAVEKTAAHTLTLRPR